MPAIPRKFKKDEALFIEGDASKCMYLIKKGTVSIQKVKGKHRVELAKVYTNEIIGELSFFDRLPRSASAYCITEVEVLEIDFASLDIAYKTVPDHMKAMINSIAGRLRRSNEIIRKLQKEGAVLSEEEEKHSQGITNQAESAMTSLSEPDLENKSA